MNREHLQAFLWLRWRLRLNQLRRGGIANMVILTLLAVASVLLALGLFVGFLLIGWFALATAKPTYVLYAWDALVVAFLFFWCVGLLTDLQRSEALGLEKFLHLPVSPAGVFLINYLSSLLSFNLIVFLPAMIGLTLGLVLSRGAGPLLLFPLVAAFLLMVTALTHQFRGWLAALMVNQRRRRTIIVFVTAAFILLTQLPNLLNLMQPWKSHRREEIAGQLAQEQEVIRKAQANGPVGAKEAQERHAAALAGYQARIEELDRQTFEQVERTTRLINLVVPVGWLPLGAAAALEGEALLVLLGIVGPILIGSASLWRSYRTTVRLYLGEFTAGRARKVAPAPTATPGKPRVNLLEKDLPWLSEHAAAIALASFRSLTRAPEAKMMLLTPVIMVVVFGSMVLTRTMNPPEGVRPLLATGAMAMILLSMVQIVGNQFGFDRGGFRVFVLCAAPRRDILLGKNLALAPLALGMSLIVIILVQLLYPMRLDYFLAAVPELISMYLLFCVLANFLSILAPMSVPAGSFKPAYTKGIPLLLHFAFVFLFPIATSLVLVPLGVAVVFDLLGWLPGVPICLVLAVLECAAILFLYRVVLALQGKLLQAREQRILEIVTKGQ